MIIIHKYLGSASCYKGRSDEDGRRTFSWGLKARMGVDFGSNVTVLSLKP